MAEVFILYWTALWVTTIVGGCSLAFFYPDAALELLRRAWMKWDAWIRGE